MKALWKLLRGNRMAMIGVTILGLFFLLAVAAPLLTSHEPDKRTGNPHEYPAFVVKAAKANPDAGLPKT